MWGVTILIVGFLGRYVLCDFLLDLVVGWLVLVVGID